MEYPSSSLSAAKEKMGLGWKEWLRGWFILIMEVMFQKLSLHNPLPLPSMSGRTCIVTGSTSGIGIEIARLLAESGAHVVMAVRNTSAAHDLIRKWQSKRSVSLPLDIEVMELNLLSLDSVVRFCREWNSRSKPLHVLVNNAGIYKMGQPKKLSRDGYEEHIQVNHLAPALLSVLLLPSLVRESSSRIINVNSTMHFFASIDTDDMNYDSKESEFTSKDAYSRSKLAEVMFSSILQMRLPAEKEVSVVCVSPGCVRTNVTRDLPKFIQEAYHTVLFCLLNAHQGSWSALYAATDCFIPKYCSSLKADEWPVCAYISHGCRPMKPSAKAHNIQTARRVWDKTLDMVGLPSDAVERILEGEHVQCRYGDSLE